MKISITLLVGFVFIFNLSCQKPAGDRRKIRLSEGTTATRTDDQLTTTIHLEPSLRRAIAVMFFENRTGDESLEWLQKGLTEMFIRTLSQFQSLSVLSTDRLYEVLERVGGAGSSGPIDMDMAAVVAREADVEVLVTGNVTRVGDSLRINVRVHESKGGQVLKEESVEGPGLEAIFGMVDDLTQKIKNNLQAEGELNRGIADLSTNSLEAWRHYTAGVDLINKFMPLDAIPQLEKAVELDPDFVSARIDLCNLYLNRKGVRAAAELFKELQVLMDKATSKERYRIYLLEARIKGDDTAIVSTLNEWVKNDPYDRDANYSLAELYVGWNDRGKAIDYLKRTLEIDPRYKLAYNYLGYQFANAGHFSEAVSHLERYQELAPDEPNPYDSMGDIYFWNGDYRKAEKSYRQALEKNDAFSASRRNLVMLYSEKGEYERALRILEQPVEKIAEDTSAVYAMRAYVYDRMGEREKAVESFERALEKNPLDFNVIERLRDIYLANNDTIKVREMIQNTYSHYQEQGKSDARLFNYAMMLGVIAFYGNVNLDETIDVLKNAIDHLEKTTAEPMDKLNLTNLRFLLTLLYIKSNRLDQIDRLWPGDELIPEELWDFLRGIQRFEYSDEWRYWTFLNQVYYQDAESGVILYEPFIKKALNYKAKTAEMMFRCFLTDVYAHGGSRKRAGFHLSKLGMPMETRWMVIGPFENQDGFRRRFPPERQTHLDRTYREESRNLAWQHADDGVYDGFVNLRTIYETYCWSVAYGLIFVYSPEDEEVQLRIGTDDGSKVWLNDREIWKFNQGGPAIFDDNRIDVRLKEGLNKILVKVCNGVGDWGYFFRITDKEGNGVSGIEFVPADEVLETAP